MQTHARIPSLLPASCSSCFRTIAASSRQRYNFHGNEFVLAADVVVVLAGDKAAEGDLADFDAGDAADETDETLEGDDDAGSS